MQVSTCDRFVPPIFDNSNTRVCGFAVERRWLTSLALPIALVVHGCGGNAAEHAPLGTLDSAINNGSATSNTVPYNAVYAAYFFGAGGQRCTATKIIDGSQVVGGDWFLTAAHCAQAMLDFINQDNTVNLTTAASGTGGPSYTLSHVMVHPSYGAAHVLDGDTVNAEGDGVVPTNVYDVGLFQIFDTLAGPIWPTSLPSGFLPTGSSVTFVGAGDDDIHPENENRKQQATETTEDGSGAARHTRFIVTRTPTTLIPEAFQSANEGDSGGPLFTGSGSSALLWGVASYAHCNAPGPGEDDPCAFSEGTESGFTRISNVLRWVQLRHNLDDTVDFGGNPIIATNSEVFLQNRGQRQCITHDSFSDSIGLAECGQRNSLGGLFPQNYKLILREAPDYYGFQNTATGKCLRATESNTIIPFNCSSSSQYQRFRIDLSSFPRVRLKPKSFGTCVNSIHPGVIRHTNCNNNDPRHEWLLYR